LSIVHFPDPLIVAVGSASARCSHGPRCLFSGGRCVSTLILPLPLMCGPASTGSRLSETKGTWRSGAGRTARALRWFRPWFYFPAGGISSFPFHFLPPSCGEAWAERCVATGSSSPGTGWLARRPWRPPLLVRGESGMATHVPLLGLEGQVGLEHPLTCLLFFFSRLPLRTVASQT
jgi:hypothetical protein